MKNDIAALTDQITDALNSFAGAASKQARRGYKEARAQTFPGKFAFPSIVLREGETNSGAIEAAHAWSDAVAEG